VTLRNILLPLVLLTLATAACAQTRDDLPAPIQALQERGIEIVAEFDAPGDLTGYAGIANQQPVAMYVTGDGQYVIVGSMLNSSGELEDWETLEKLVAEPMTKRAWSELEHSEWIAEGDAGAEHVLYAFMDPSCPFCHMFWTQVRPWVESGKVQLRYIMVGVISEQSPNKAAAIMTADDPLAAFTRNEKQFDNGGIEPLENIPAQTQNALMANQRLMTQMGIQGTPGIAYLDADGHIQFWRGVPKKEDMIEVLGEP